MNTIQVGQHFYDLFSHRISYSFSIFYIHISEYGCDWTNWCQRLTTGHGLKTEIYVVHIIAVVS